MEGNGWQVRHNAIPVPRVRKALRAINLYLMYHGLSADDIKLWRDNGKWFWRMTDTDYPPAKPVLALADGFPEVEVRYTQILLQFPAETREEPAFHQDDNNVDGLILKRIVCVPLTNAGGGLGGLSFLDGEPVVFPGDYIEFQNVPHHGGVNESGAIRYAVYFREFERSE